MWRLEVLFQDGILYYRSPREQTIKALLYKNYWIYQKDKVIFVIDMFELCYMGILVNIGGIKPGKSRNQWITRKIAETALLTRNFENFKTENSNVCYWVAACSGVCVGVHVSAKISLLLLTYKAS